MASSQFNTGVKRTWFNINFSEITLTQSGSGMYYASNLFSMPNNTIVGACIGSWSAVSANDNIQPYIASGTNEVGIMVNNNKRTGGVQIMVSYI